MGFPMRRSQLWNLKPCVVPHVNTPGPRVAGRFFQRYREMGEDLVEEVSNCRKNAQDEDSRKECFLDTLHSCLHKCGRPIWFPESMIYKGWAFPHLCVNLQGKLQGYGGYMLGDCFFVSYLFRLIICGRVEPEK